MKYKLINQKTKEEHLCDKVAIDGFDYYYNDDEFGDNDYYYDTKQKSLRFGSNNHVTGGYKKKVIATNNTSIDIPKVVYEFDLDELLGEWKYRLGLKESKDKADEKFEKGYSVDSVKDKISHRFGYVYGIKEAEKRLVPVIMELKSQETHSFSEEDMIEFWIEAHKIIMAQSGKSFTPEELIQLWKDQQPKVIYYD